MACFLQFATGCFVHAAFVPLARQGDAQRRGEQGQKTDHGPVLRPGHIGGPFLRWAKAFPPPAVAASSWTFALGQNPEERRLRVGGARRQHQHIDSMGFQLSPECLAQRANIRLGSGIGGRPWEAHEAFHRACDNIPPCLFDEPGANAW